MAATRLIALHKNKGKSVATCLKSRTDYAQNPEKTKQGELVSSYECSPLTVDEEFMLSKRQYELATGRRQKSDVIAYQIRQSFKPGEITAEEANKVGYELAMRFTKGKYAGSAAMLGVGSASVLSRAIGKKDENTIKKIMGNLVAMVLLLSVIYTVVGMVFTRQLLSLTGASDNILNYAEKYLRIVFAGSLFVNFFQSANMVIRGEGQLKRAMTIIASGAILNIILDPIFISILNPYGMGIEAAAYATIFSQFVQAAITLWYFKKKSPHVKIGRIRIDGELLPQVLSVGISALLMQILTLVQQTVIYRVASNYGGETSQLLLAAALRFWNFSFVPLWGISQGFQPAAGTNYGAKDYDRVKTLTRVFIIAATLLSLVFYIPAELFPEKILSMFLTTPGIAASGATNFRIMFSTYILQGSFMIAVTLFQSLGKAKKATWLVLFRQIILFIPLCVVLPMIGGMGIRGVWLAIALTDAILVAIIAFMVAYEFRKLPATSSVNR